MKILIRTFVFTAALACPISAFGATPCQQPLTPPAQYGAAAHAALGSKDYATVATCEADSVTITTNPIPDQTQLYFNTGYILQGSNWTPLTFKGGTPFKDSSGASHNTWLTSNASATSRITQTTKPTYYLFFSCTYAQNQWKCGCKDQTCQTPMWQIARFQPAAPTAENPQNSSGAPHDIPGRTFLQEDFENGFGAFKQQKCHPYSINIVGQGEMGAPKARSGNKMLRFETRQSDKAPMGCTSSARGNGLLTHRAEVLTSRLPVGKHNWVSWSIYLPPSFKPDDFRSNGFNLSQLHSGEGSCKYAMKLAVDRDGSAPFAWSFKAGYRDTKKGNTAFTANDYGRWIDFKWHSYQGGGKHISEIFKDGELLSSYDGPSKCGAEPLYFKAGIYHHNPGQNLITFVDNIKITTE